MLGGAYSRLGHRIVEGVVAAGYPQRPAHSAVFANIDVARGSRLTDLAGKANMTAQALGELVDDLERLGYVKRMPDPSDRRAKLIALTDLGMACVEEAIAVIAGIERQLGVLVGPRSLAELQRILGLIIADG
ncbi:MAG: MarR family winged helix-turn-helix transcriptional regulator [Candidatus Limnocylindria bacterium]